MKSDHSSTITSSSSVWDKLGGSTNSVTSLTFMEIRYRSLGKAIDELRNKRVHLEEELRKGHIEESQYASTLLKLIVETNTLTKERCDIEERVNAMKANRLH